MSNEVTSPTPETPAANPTETSAPVVPNGTASEPRGEAQAQGAPTEEADSFTSVDVNTLTPRERERYDNMLRDYKSKTATIAEKRKALEEKEKLFEELTSKAEQADQLLRDENIRRYLAGEYTDQASEEEAAQLVSQEDLIEAQSNPAKLGEIIDRVTEAKLASIKKNDQSTQMKVSQIEASETLKAFESAKDKDGKPLRPDFEHLLEVGLIDLTLSRFQKEGKQAKNYMELLNSVYNEAKTIRNRIYDQGKADALAQMKARAASGSEMPSNGNGNVYSGDPKKLSIAEARALAKRGIRVAG